MKKPSKITVKHFFEKKVKPQLVYNDLELGHPIYYRITYKRKTTNIRSFTGAIMTEKAYNKFNETNEVDIYETNYSNQNPNLKLENELIYIRKALDFIIEENENISAFDDSFVENLKTFFIDLKETLYTQAWRYYIQNIEFKTAQTKTKFKQYTLEQVLKLKQPPPTKEDIDFDNSFNSIDENKRHFLQEQFYYIFNKEQSLFYSLNTLKEVTGFDAFPFIHKNTIKFWHVINLILIVYPNTIFIDFLINFDLDKIIKANNNNNLVTNEEIKIICNKLKNNHLGIYFK